MIRTQIQLTEEQARALRRIAGERGVSMATLIREAVDRVLLDRTPSEERWRRALAVVGKYAGGAHDVSDDHDRHLAEAYLDWRSS
jgi:hypothetical protein